MTRRKRIEISVETERIFFIRRSGSSIPSWCTECAEAVCSVTPNEAALLAQVSTRTIYRGMEAGKLHFMEGSDGALLICLNSLSRHLTLLNLQRGRP